MSSSPDVKDSKVRVVWLIRRLSANGMMFYELQHMSREIYRSVWDRGIHGQGGQITHFCGRFPECKPTRAVVSRFWVWLGTRGGASSPPSRFLASPSEVAGNDGPWQEDSLGGFLVAGS
jgi:hypothetical protein